MVINKLLFVKHNYILIYTTKQGYWMLYYFTITDTPSGRVWLRSLFRIFADTSSGPAESQNQRNYTQVRHFEYTGIGVFVYGDDVLGGLYVRQVLHAAGYAELVPGFRLNGFN